MPNYLSLRDHFSIDLDSGGFPGDFLVSVTRHVTPDILGVRPKSGPNVYATISLSYVDTIINERVPGVTGFEGAAWIDSWTVFQKDGTQSFPVFPNYQGPTNNSVIIDNCDTITFNVAINGVGARAIAQVSIFSF